MKTFIEYYSDVHENLEYHIENDIPLNENTFRVGSRVYYELFTAARELMKEGVYTPNEIDRFLLEETDIGLYDVYEGNHVPLDCPLMEAEDGVELNSPKRGGNKKYYVYVRNDKGNVVKVEFGDTSGLKAKIDNPEARKSFAARHNCDQKKDKTKPGYWACRLPYYAKQLGLSGGGNFFW